MTDYIKVGTVDRPFRFARKALKELEQISKELNKGEFDKKELALDIALKLQKAGCLHEDVEVRTAALVVESYLSDVPKERLDRNIPGDTTVIFLGFKHGAKFENKEVNFTEQDVEDWVEAEPEVMGEALKVYKKQLGKMRGGRTEEAKSQPSPGAD